MYCRRDRRLLHLHIGRIRKDMDLHEQPGMHALVLRCYKLVTGQQKLLRTSQNAAADTKCMV